MEPLEQTATRRESADSATGVDVQAAAPMFPDTAPVSLGVLGLVAPAPQRAHSALDVVALILAIVLAPIGFIAGIVAAVLSARRRGYVTGLAKAAIVVSLILSVIGAAGGVVGGIALQRQAHEDSLRAGSSAMCTLLAEKPGVLTDAAFGWPAVDSTIPAYVTAVSAYETWWTAVAKAAPAQMRAQVEKVVASAHTAGERMAASRVVDHERDYADMRTVAASSTLPAWTTRYCG